MSAIGQLLGTVEAKVRELLADFVLKNAEQDKRLDAAEKRLDKLEEFVVDDTFTRQAKTAPAKKATAARPTAAGAKVDASK